METLVLTKQTFSYEKMGDQAFGVTLRMEEFFEVIVSKCFVGNIYTFSQFGTI